MADKSKKTEREILLQDLRTLIKKLPDDGLRFLLDQAKVLEYNMQADEINRAREAASNQVQTGAGAKGKSDKAGSPGTAERVRIDKGTFGGSRFLVIGGQRKIMDPEEIDALIYVVKKSKSIKEGAAGLFRWFQRERDDVLMDAGIGSGDPVLEELYTYLRSFDNM